MIATSNKDEQKPRMGENGPQHAQDEREVPRSQQRTRAILDSLDAGIVVIDQEGTIRTVNKKWRRVAQELEGAHAMKEGSNYLDALRQLATAGNADAEKVLCGLEAVMDGKVERFVFEYPSPLGHTDRWYQLHATPLKHNPGQVVIAHRNVRARKKTELALRQSEERLRRTLAEAPIPVIIHAEDGEILLLSEKWLELTGYTAADLPDLDAWMERAYGHMKEANKALLDKLYQEEQVVRIGNRQVRTASGDVQIWDFSSAPAGRLADGRRLRVTMALDLTERDRQEREIEQRAHNLTFLNDLGRTINRASDLDQVVQSTLEQIVALPEVDSAYCMLPDEHGQMQLIMHRTLLPSLREWLEDEDTFRCALGQDTNDDRLFYSSDNQVQANCRCAQAGATAGYRTTLCVPMMGRQQVLGRLILHSRKADAFGMPTRGLVRLAGRQLGVAVERARLFERERAQRQYLEALQEASNTFNSSLDVGHVLDHILAALASILSYDSASVLLCEGEEVLIAAGRGLPEGAVGQRFTAKDDYFIGQMRATRQPIIVADVQQDPRFHGWGGVSQVRGWMTVPLLSRTGLLGYLTLDSYQPHTYSENDASQAMTLAYHAATAVENAKLHEDVQSQLQALEATQARLLQSEKLAALGQMIAGVAHELNNPLGAITLMAQRWQRHQGPVSPEDLKMVVTQAQRARDIVASLLNFSRRQPLAYAPVQVNDIIRSTLELLAYEMRTRQVMWSADLDSELPLVEADSSQLQQVFVNLFQNAFQAMSDDSSAGHLRVTTEVGPSRYYRPASGLPPQMVRVTVSDNGPGIPPSLLSRVFDPFFTTKEIGEGTGLGLSVCHGIITEHQGHIWAESRLGDGAKILIELPLLSEDFDAQASVLESPTTTTVSSTGGKGRILALDDERSLQAAMTLILEDGGYEVDAVGTGQEALALLAAQPYDLILCDIRMPGLSGYEFYQKLLVKHEALARRIIFITGDTVSPETRNFFKENDLPYLQKPFGIEELLTKIGNRLALA